MSATIRVGESIAAADYRRSTWEMGGLKILTVRPLAKLRPNVWLCVNELDCPDYMDVLIVHQSSMFCLGNDVAPRQEDIEHPIVTLAGSDGGDGIHVKAGGVWESKFGTATP